MELDKILLSTKYPFESALKAMVFYGYVDVFPVLFAIESRGESSLWSFYYDGERIQYFLPKKPEFLDNETYRLAKLPLKSTV